MWNALKADLKNASGFTLIGSTALVAWLVFQWGFGNDSILFTTAANAFDLVDDRSTWPSGWAAVAFATFAGFSFWGITQAIDVLVVMTSAERIPLTVAHMSEQASRRGWIKPYSELSLLTRVGIAYGAGASVLCLIDVIATGRPGLRNRIPMAGIAVLISATGVGMVTAIITTAAMVGTRIPSTEDEADVLIKYAKNPFIWLGFFAVLFAIKWFSARLRSSDDE